MRGGRRRPGGRHREQDADRRFARRRARRLCHKAVSPAGGAWDAFYECKPKAPTAVLEQIQEDGAISYSAREGDVGIMQRCLEEKFGYRFH